jgi:hypothetical protein
MNFVLQSNQSSLLSVSPEELLAVTNALNEVCNGIDIPDAEFQTRIGVSREFLATLLGRLLGEVHPDRLAPQIAHVWTDHGSLMVRAVTAFGDPVEMGESEAAEFSKQLRQAIAAAS